MASWVRTITSPFRKARTFFNQQQPRDKKSHHQEHDENNNHDDGYCGGGEVMDLHGEVMACSYEDVQVMWSILDDKSKSSIIPAAAS